MVTRRGVWIPAGRALELAHLLHEASAGRQHTAVGRDLAGWSGALQEICDRIAIASDDGRLVVAEHGSTAAGRLAGVIL